jgi:hypothetical protein
VLLRHSWFVADEEIQARLLITNSIDAISVIMGFTRRIYVKLVMWNDGGGARARCRGGLDTEVD